MTPKPPDWDVTTYRKSTHTREKIGVGWSNDPDGRVILKFEKSVTIPADRDLVVTLFKKTPRVWGDGESVEGSAPTSTNTVKTSSSIDRLEEMAGQMIEDRSEDDGPTHTVVPKDVFSGAGHVVVRCSICARRVAERDGTWYHVGVE